MAGIQTEGIAIEWTCICAGERKKCIQIVGGQTSLGYFRVLESNETIILKLISGKCVLTIRNFLTTFICNNFGLSLFSDSDRCASRTIDSLKRLRKTRKVDCGLNAC